jgi:hypothetical protein
MILIKTVLLFLFGFFLMGISESSKNEQTLVSKDVIMSTLLNQLTGKGISIKVPHYMEENFTVVFDELPDLKPKEKKSIERLKLKEMSLRDVEIKVKLDDLLPVSSTGDGGEPVQQHFLLNDKNDVRLKIKSFQIGAVLKIKRKGKNVLGKKRQPKKFTIEKFELKDIDSLFNFYLGKDGNGYYAEDMALKRMVLSPKATVKIKEFPPMINKIISKRLGPNIAKTANKEVLNDAFYKQFNANLPPRIPEPGSPSLPGILNDILN